jgi:peptidoglycan lytic transglycosylase G
MVERQPLTRNGRKPTREQLIARRALAIGALLLVIAVIAWGAFALFGAGSGAGGTTAAVLPPPPKPLRIVFPEGFTRRDMAARITAVDKIAKRKRGVTPKLSAPAYLAATQRARRIEGFGAKRYPLEGFLFPATYDFLPSTTSKQLAGKQLTAFDRNWGQLDLSYAKSKNLTPYDVLIIASMVERETLAPDERRLVAAVIYNRLHAGMPLGIDATIRYALNVPGTQSLRESQLQNPTPYNTRLHVGLPPTPIGNPGLASMQAAAHPAKVDYLYFVRKPDKVHHFFTASYAAFQNYANAHGF